MADFWSSALLRTGRYSGHPVEEHRKISELADGHFDRWIALFEDTANALCPPVAAAHFIERARRIADSLELGIASSRGKIASPRFSTAERRSARPATAAEPVSCG
jgi:hemoglobin